MNKFGIILVLFALLGLPGQAQGDREAKQLLRTLRTASLTRLTLALGPKRLPDLKPAIRSKAMGHIRAANRKIALILDNPKLTPEVKKQRLIQAQNEGAARVVRELGPLEKTLKAAFTGLQGEVYWDEPVYQAFPAEALSVLKKQVQAADAYGGNAGFRLSGWGDVG